MFQQILFQSPLFCSLANQLYIQFQVLLLQILKEEVFAFQLLIHTAKVCNTDTPHKLILINPGQEIYEYLKHSQK